MTEIELWHNQPIPKAISATDTQLPKNVFIPRYEVSSTREITQIENHVRLCEQIGRTSINGLRRVEMPSVDAFDEMELELSGALIGQDEVVHEVVEVLASDSLRDKNKPRGCFLFAGPTGVGKTELARALNRHFGYEDYELVRLDGSDYAEGHNVATLTGAPPGYVGREQVAKLKQENVEGKYRVVLVDEIEKSADQLHTLLLQIAEEGELQMKDGSTSSFRDTVLILTTNIGADKIQAEISRTHRGFTASNDDSLPVDRQAIQNIVKNELKKHLRPELINRMDAISAFMPLNDDQLSEVLNQYVARNNVDYAEEGIEVVLTDELRAGLVEDSPERKEYGGRHVVKNFNKTVLSRLARALSAGNIPRGSKVYVVKSEGKEFGFEFYYEEDEELLRRYRKTQLAQLGAIGTSLASVGAQERVGQRDEEEEDFLNDDDDELGPDDGNRGLN